MRLKSIGAAFAAAVLSACVLAGPAQADNYQVRDGAGVSQTFCSRVVGALQYPCHLVYGLFGSSPTPIKVDSEGAVAVNVQTALLPTGAATAAKQPAIGTAGAASPDVMSVQGVASMVPFKVLADALPLPGGASTAALQANANASLAAIDAKLGAGLTVTCASGCTGGGGSGSGTEFAEDSSHVSGAMGSLVFGVRKDTPAALAGTDGDYTASIYDALNRLWVNVGAFTATSLPLPTGAATEASLTAARGTFGSILADKVVIHDASGNPIDFNATSPVALAASASGGCSPYGYQSAASNNANVIKASAGTLCSLNVINTTATLYYLRLYNLAAAPTCSSASGFVKTIPIPASATGAGVALDLGAYGEAYATGLAFCLTAGGGSTDNTNAATGVYVSASYK